MKKINIILIFLTILSLPVIAQNWSMAPEVWSEPVLLDSVFNKQYMWLESPSLTPNMDTLYLDMGDGVYSSYKVNGKWQEPVMLNSNINPGGTATRFPTISKDGKKLYFSGWGGYGGWDLWYSDWDDTLNDWSEAINMGPKINTSGHDLYLYEVGKDTIYVTQQSRYLSFYVLDKNTQQWEKVDDFRYHPLGGVEMYGLSLTGDNQKMYFGKRRWEKEWALDLCVTYWDTTKNYWGDVFYLNLNTQSIPWGNITKRGGEYYPWISPDGKTLIFSSNRNVPVHPDSGDNTSNLFISYLLVDENGDTVTSVENTPTLMTNSFSLIQNYPNPFNPTTTITFSIPQQEKVELVVYDILGRKVVELINQTMEAGKYEIDFEGSNLSSGTYIYKITAGKYIESKKMLLIK